METKQETEEEFKRFLWKHRDTFELGPYLPRLNKDGEDIGGEYEIWLHGAEEGRSHWYVDADLLEEVFHFEEKCHKK